MLKEHIQRLEASINRINEILKQDFKFSVPTSRDEISYRYMRSDTKRKVAKIRYLYEYRCSRKNLHFTSIIIFLKKNVFNYSDELLDFIILHELIHLVQELGFLKNSQKVHCKEFYDYICSKYSKEKIDYLKQLIERI